MEENPAPLIAQARRFLEDLRLFEGEDFIAPPAGEEAQAPAGESLEEFRGRICACTRCPLGHTRQQFVFGAGNPEAGLVFVGEAPGEEEDRQGIPFVGAAGQLLTRIIEAMQLRREEVYICNTVKCRPPENRQPTPEEMAECAPYLQKQIEIIRPRIICALGRVAAQALLKTDAPLRALRGKLHEYRGIPVLVTYHPAALLRRAELKRETWEDMKWLRREYDGVEL